MSTKALNQRPTPQAAARPPQGNHAPQGNPAPRVYVVHAPLRYDGRTASWVHKVDLSPAEEFGQLVHMLPPQSGSNVGIDMAQCVADLRASLEAFTAEDYLLPVGHPVLIGAATAIAARRTGGTVRLLEWNRDTVDGYYRPVLLRLWEAEGR